MGSLSTLVVLSDSLRREKTSKIRKAKWEERGERTERNRGVKRDSKKHIFQKCFDLRRHLMPRYDVWRMDTSWAMGASEFILFSRKEPNHVCVE